MTLNVAAAASLRDAVAALTDAYAAAHPSVSFTVTTDSSAALRTQIEQGAPVDVFLSADTRNPQALVDGGLAAGDPIPFAANAVALVVPADNPARIATPADLATPGLRFIAAGDEVPITAYANQVTANLAATQADPAAWTAAVDANVASREDNVAAVLARIELGEGDAGFVYATDAARSDGVTDDRDPRRRQRPHLARGRRPDDCRRTRTPPRRSSTGSRDRSARRSSVRSGSWQP